MVPYCTEFGRFGADVIKVETLEGDNTRYIGPSVNKGMGAVFLNLIEIKKVLLSILKKKREKKLFIN